MGRSQWMTCPRKVIFVQEILNNPPFLNAMRLQLISRNLQDLSTGWLRCDPGPLFKPEYYPLPQWVSQLVSITWVLLLAHDVYFQLLFLCIRLKDQASMSNQIREVDTSLSFYLSQ